MMSGEKTSSRSRPEEPGEFEGRKRDHIRLSLDDRTQASDRSGLGQVRLIHEALPEIDLNDVDLRSSLFGRDLATPLYISGMTAGHDQAPALNRTLAAACERRGWIMGVGSQRRELERPKDSVDRWSEIRSRYPHLFLVGNLGISQLAQLQPTEIDQVRSVCRALDAQAMAIHLNAMQEALQPEGTPFFRKGLETITHFAKNLGAPVIVKETGCGISKKTLRSLASAGVKAVDVSGLGGTHWGRIEGFRASTGSIQAEAAGTFADWGEPLVESVLAAREVVLELRASGKTPDFEVWASGGVRSGLDAAKLLALGAHRVGFAQPALRAALQSEEALDRWMAQIEFELKVALFCTGSRTPQQLREGEQKWKFA
jgi:isopentenyl-diphosphate delta-isomerase